MKKLIKRKLRLDPICKQKKKKNNITFIFIDINGIKYKPKTNKKMNTRFMKENVQKKN